MKNKISIVLMTKLTTLLFIIVVSNIASLSLADITVGEEEDIVEEDATGGGGGGNSGGGGGGGGGMPNFDSLKKACPNFQCTKGFVPVQKNRSRFQSAGCSGMTGGGLAMQMQMPGGGLEPYEPCCDQFNACYQTCGSPKKTCEDTFKVCSTKLCKTAADPEKCERDAGMKTMLLELGGCTTYDQGQYMACECTAKNKVEEKRSEALRYFYKKYAPDNVDKVAALAKKADSTAKMAKLFRQLLLKYPAAIKKIKDPMAERMEKMMKDGQLNNEKEKEKEASTEEEEQDDSERIEL